MPVNPDYEYVNALKEYEKAQTDIEKLKALQFMLSKCPSHKGAQVLRSDIKKKIAKLKLLLQKQKTKKSGFSLSIKKEGAATISIVGTTNTGKSTLLKALTNANVAIASYPFTTKKPEKGMLDYHGIKLQIIEIPALTQNFQETGLGPSLLSIIRQSDLIILCFNTPKEKQLLDLELENAEITVPILIYNNQTIEELKNQIWSRLNIIKVYTKEPGKKPSYPPIALPKNSTIESLAKNIHKDFIKRFKFARVWGKSSKFKGMNYGLNHILADDDIVEIHLK